MAHRHPQYSVSAAHAMVELERHVGQRLAIHLQVHSLLGASGKTSTCLRPSKVEQESVRHLTNRSSRDRFAASCEFCSFSLAQGRKAVRLNSGVSWGQRWVQACEFSGEISHARTVCAWEARNKSSRKSGLPARTKREFGTTLVATAQKSDQRLVSQLTSRSSRARFAVSSRTHSPDAGRLNSGVRRLPDNRGFQ